MKVLITGAGGFLGEELVKVLRMTEGIDLYAVTSAVKRLQQNYSDITVLERNCIVSEEFNFCDIDVLVSCAFPRTSAGKEFDDGIAYVMKVVHKFAEESKGFIIDISSQSVYNPQRTEAAVELDPPDTTTQYALGKYMMELFTDYVCKSISRVHLRLSSLIGVGFDSRLVNKFVNQVINKQDIKLTGGDQVFQFMDVRDAALAIKEIIIGTEQPMESEIYNIGVDEKYTLKQIAQKVIDIGREFGFDDTKTVIEEGGIWSNSSVDCSKFSRAYDWHMRYSLDTTIRDIFKNKLY